MCNHTTRPSTPTIILLPFGRMLVVDRNFFNQINLDTTNGGIDFMELSANLIRTNRDRSTSSILDTSETSKCLTPLSCNNFTNPPSYSDIFNCFNRNNDLPPSYSELSLLIVNEKKKESNIIVNCQTITNNNQPSINGIQIPTNRNQTVTDRNETLTKWNQTSVNRNLSSSNRIRMSMNDIQTLTNRNDSFRTLTSSLNDLTRTYTTTSDYKRVLRSETRDVLVFIDDKFDRNCNQSTSRSISDGYLYGCTTSSSTSKNVAEDVFKLISKGNSL